MSEDELPKDAAFFLAVRLDQLDYIEKLLIKYIGEQPYLICGEIAEGTHIATDGEHMHIWCKMKDTDYHKFTKVVKTKFKLRGTPGKKGTPDEGKCKQYGKISKIESVERLKIYYLKDQDEENTMVRTNMSEKEIETLKARSFKKAENHQKWVKLCTIAHKLIFEKLEESNQKYYDDNPTYTSEDGLYKIYGKNEEYQPYDKKSGYECLGKKGQIEWLAKVNYHHREIYDGLPMTKNTMMKLLFKFEQISDYDYIENLMRFI